VGETITIKRKYLEVLARSKIDRIETTLNQIGAQMSAFSDALANLETQVAAEDTVASLTVDVVICPAAAVDETGTRLGWGGGYYDRFLTDLPAGIPVFALVFDDDVVADLPREAHDVPVTGVVTPSGWRRFLSR
jgi:5,10-methenyltetrahydrofolate synthetase